MVGNSLTFVAVPWFVVHTTGSAAKTGLSGGAIALALVLAGFFGGPMVDRLGFRRTSIAADVMSGVTVAMIPLLYDTVGLAFWQLLALVFLGSFFDAPGSSARLNLISDLARKTGMPRERANSAFQAMERSSLLVGPPLAGALRAAFGASNVLWIAGEPGSRYGALSRCTGLSSSGSGRVRVAIRWPAPDVCTCI